MGSGQLASPPGTGHSPLLTAHCPLPTETDRFLGRTLSRLRWAIIGALMLVILAQPVTGRSGHPIWLLILVFAGYNLLIELLRPRLPRVRSFRWVPFFDLPVVAGLYSLDHGPNGPIFVLFFLAVISAAATMSLRGVVAYTVAVVVVVVAIVPTFPWWQLDEWSIREVGSRLVVLTLVGIGTSFLTRRLALEQEAARSMRDEAERLEELDRLRAGFISTVSHDLRTPLTAARAGLGMLETSAVDRLQPAERDLVSNARRNVERLAMSIDDLLTVNQLEAGALRLDREPIDLRAIVTDAMSAVHPLLREKGQPLEVDLPDPLPADGDPHRLEQVIVNLLANAYRHTPAGTRIAISGRLADGELVLTVRDDGPGIPPAEHQAVFRRFHRLSAAGNGSGLGLEIARSIVELHGGRIWVESEPGQGAALHVALPRRVEGPERS